LPDETPRVFIVICGSSAIEAYIKITVLGRARRSVTKKMVLRTTAFFIRRLDTDANVIASPSRRMDIESACE
jgi:hypothetical protein